jgi:hypothetical protein
MYKTISNKIIREFNPCYDPSDVIKDENEELPIKDWVRKYRNDVPSKDILWLLLREEFMSEKDLRLFVVWCAREVLKLIKNPDERSVNACNVAERYANGEATKEELFAARKAALDAAHAAVDIATHTVAYHVYYAAYHVYSATHYATSTAYAVASAVYAVLASRDTIFSDDAADAARSTRALQIDKLLTYFE